MKDMKITKYLNDNIIYLDGGFGTVAMRRGLITPGTLTEELNLTHADEVVAIHREYYDSGSNIVCTNTFGANALKYSEERLAEVIRAGVALAKRARLESQSAGEKWVALDIGPSGKMLKPLGDLAFEDAVELFSKSIRIGVSEGVDLIFIETMTDSYETKAAVLAAKECCDLPIFVSNAYGDDGKLMTGATPSAMVAMLEGLGVQAIGVNCSYGPASLIPVINEYLERASVPVIFKPNAGLPHTVDGVTVYDLTPEEFASQVKSAVKGGVRIVGGCCGTSPEYISALVSACDGIKPLRVEKKNITVISSYTHSLDIGDMPLLIGERINPTGKKLLKEALRRGDMDYILGEGIKQEELGAHALDVNVGLPEIDEKKMLTAAVSELQAVIDLPLQIDTSDISAMEAALRIYNGKALVNSVNGKEESMRAVFPLVKKYGGVLICLTLDEDGIPERAEGRVEIARRIIKRAAEYGIDKCDLVFDPLALTVSADDNAARETLIAVSRIKNELGCNTSLGVSNVSFGLPRREIVNSTFFAMALGAGLSAAIMNPASADMMRTYRAYMALSGKDRGCEKYMSFAEALTDAPTPTAVQAKAAVDISEGKSELESAIIKGLSERAAALTGELIARGAPILDVVNSHIIPALDTVGVGYENKTIYLPRLLMSAEAAKASFEVIKGATARCDTLGEKIVLATVEGDIHDIGKNIVKLILENYGYNVIDLGKDVKCELVADTVKKEGAKLVGLSALMTTTTPNMQRTIELIRATSPECKIIVGGAVLTEKYAKSIGADKYAPDAMEAVRYAKEVFG